MPLLLPAWGHTATPGQWPAIDGAADTASPAELRQNLLWHRMRFQAAGPRIAHRPHPRIRAFGAKLAFEAQAVRDLEAGAAEFGGGVNRHVVAETRRLEKAGLGAHKRS